MAFLSGYKTYISAVSIGVVVIIYQAGLIDISAYNTLMGILAAVGLGTLRAGMDNANQKTFGK